MKPYYQDEAVTIYHGDCRDILPQLPKVDLVLTDPPWPNLTEGMNTDSPYALFSDFSRICFPNITDRAVIILGCDSDPRFLLPINLPYFNTCWIKRTPPFFKGSKFIGADMAYVFGNFHSPTGRGNTVFSQEFQMVSQGKRKNNHPAPRNQKTINALVSVYSMPTWCILDPFMGSGTTLRAAKDLGRKAIGIDVKESYCEMAATEMSQAVFDLSAERG